MDEYLAGAGISDDKASPLFRTAAGRKGKLTELRMNRTDALRMIGRRASAAELRPSSAATHSGRVASPSTSRTGSSSTRSRWPHTRARGQPSRATAGTIRSRLIKLSGL
jgi:hypothetical protein